MTSAEDDWWPVKSERAGLHKEKPPGGNDEGLAGAVTDERLALNDENYQRTLKAGLRRGRIVLQVIHLERSCRLFSVVITCFVLFLIK